MKKHLFVIILMMSAASFVSQAQSQVQQGHFIIGMDALSLYANKESTVTQYNQYNGNNSYTVQSDTSHSTDKGVNAQINIFVGYFITKNICAGLQFATNVPNYFGTFIRYYFNHKKRDSAKIDFFIQANGSFNYDNMDDPFQYTQYEPGIDYTSQSDHSITQTSLNFGLNVAAAFHITKHWALEAELGYIYGSSIQDYGSYTQISYNYNITPYLNTVTEPATTNKYNFNGAALSLNLHYFL